MLKKYFFVFAPPTNKLYDFVRVMLADIRLCFISTRHSVHSWADKAAYARGLL